jgi:hypothetical protein
MGGPFLAALASFVLSFDGQPNGLVFSQVGRARGTRRTAILNCHNDHAVLVFEMDIHEKEPTPGTEEKTEAAPPTAQFRAHEGELFERCEGSLDALNRVGRQAVRPD